MMFFNARLNSIKIKNLKNIFSGVVEISKKDVDDDESYICDIIGIYGQNGSGKTTVIQSLDLLKRLILGFPFWSDMQYCISNNKTTCQLSFDYSLLTESGAEYKIIYEIIFEKNAENFCFIKRETLKFSKKDGENWSNLKSIFDCNFSSDEKVFEPKNRYEILIKSNKANKINIPVAMKLAQERKTSLLFSNDFFKILNESSDKEFFEIVSTFKKYANEKLFIIQNSHNGIISLNVMPLAILHSEGTVQLVGDIAINLKEPLVTDSKTFEIVSSAINNMNIVMKALIPGLSIGIKNLGNQSLQSGEIGTRYEIISERNGAEFPIRYESEGIKKLLSVLSLLIAMYNDSSVLVAVDELDAGIFEALLGTFLHVIKETGKGQLVFTSHNLRPLEVLDKKNIVFTTTNPENRYIRLKNVKDRNNLRDIYIRALTLGGQEEELSTEVHEVDVRRALRKAGKDGKN